MNKTRQELIDALKQSFHVQELVCSHCYNKFGEASWQFLSTELLSTLYTLRFEVLKVPMTINTWHNNGQFSQRGLRCNMCSLVKQKSSIYMSAHCLGKAIDFNAKDQSAEETRKIIKANIDKFEYPIRLEKDVTWVHIDVMQPNGSTANLVEFNG